MVNFHRILVPVDVSETVASVLATAADLARRYGAHLTLLSVYQPPLLPLPPDGVIAASAALQAEQVTAIKTQLDELQRRLEGDGAGAITTHIAQGDPYEEILRELNDGRHDLIVMSTHGRTGLMHVLWGSVAERIVRHAPCPVLVLRGPAPRKG